MVRKWWKKSRAPRDVEAELVGARVLTRCEDETASASSVLAEAAIGGVDELLLRHVAVVPGDAAEEFVRRCAVDGYVHAPALSSDPIAPDGAVAVAVARLQKIDARSVSAERALLSSMTARSGGAFGGWAVLAPASVATVTE
ncbi:hypothetical protein MUG78_16405 [Gordonia alkaliphila]|uniref:hypothetical protein n=1 Tax=Gordonia alkaliphila TaxID=1053547 RepID=UPI001FF1FF70|nr:hypothetical protein [Gordonia alkaliphila]MCK0440991.1 hypothetical protein [Gordonia alkaliphila]